MRVAMIVVSIFVVSTPSEASKSCMTRTEARQQFGSYIYWHGRDQCWDATPPRGQHQIAHRVQRKIDQPKWRDAMSAISPNETPSMLPKEPAQAPLVDHRAEVWPSVIDARWVDFAQVPQSIIERKPEPAVMPRGALLVLAFIAYAVMAVIIEVLFRATFYNRPTRFGWLKTRTTSC